MKHGFNSNNLAFTTPAKETDSFFYFVFYLTAVLAGVVVGALVLIDAESSRLIKLESSRTDTPETAKSIDTCARFRTGSRLVALVYI